MARMTQTDIMGRLGSIETTLEHLATREQVAALNEKVRHIEERMPELTGNTHRADRGEGWRDAKEDSEKDARGILAIIISGLALAVSALTNWWSGQ